MKRAVIIHCWGGNPDYAWYPWLKTELEKLGYSVSVPLMPNTDEPILDEWLPQLQRTVGQVDEELLLVGHSLGTVTIMRYLETLKDDEKINKAILVAGFTDPLGFKELENFFETPINLELVKPRSLNGFSVIQSDNDPYVPAQFGTLLESELGANLIIKHDAGHMSGPVDDEESCDQLPEVLLEI